MSSSVTALEFTQVMNAIVKCQQEGNVRVPAMLHGMHGIGKTEVVGQFANDKNMNFVTLHLSTQDVGELIGLPTKTTSEYICQETGKTLTKEITTYAEPEWLWKAKLDPRPCVFFLDEFNRAPSYVLQTMLPFVLDGIIHCHGVRPQDVILAAANPDTVDFNVQTFDDKALQSRFAHFYFEPEMAEWLDHCGKIDCHPALLNIVKLDIKSKFDTNHIAVPVDARIVAEPTRRNATKVGQIMNILTEDEMKAVGYKLFSAMIGSDVATPLIQEYNAKRMLTIEDVLTGAALKDIGNDLNQHIDVVTILNESIASMIGENLKKNVAWSIDTKGKVKSKLNKRQLNHLKKWINAMNIDSQYGMLRTIKKTFTAKNTQFNDDKEAHAKLSEFIDVVDEDFIIRTVHVATTSAKK